MLKGRSPLDWFRKQKNEPQIFQVTCTKCNYAEKLELKSDSVRVWRNPDMDHSQDPRLVTELPALCAECGAKLKSERVPVWLKY